MYGAIWHDNLDEYRSLQREIETNTNFLLWGRQLSVGILVPGLRANTAYGATAIAARSGREGKNGSILAGGNLHQRSPLCAMFKLTVGAICKCASRQGFFVSLAGRAALYCATFSTGVTDHVV